MKVYVKTFGCTLNKFDSLSMKRILLSSGYHLVEDPDESDVLIINTCGVKKQTEDRIISYLKQLNIRYGRRKKIVVAGCLPIINLDRLIKETRSDAIVGVSPGYKILDILSKLNTNRPIIDVWSGGQSPLIPPTYSAGVIEPIGISFGCLDNCAFCATKFARSKLNSIPIDKIVDHIEKCLKLGVKEFYLTSPDSGAYGFDLKPRRNIIDLLREIEKIDGIFKVRLGMINPRWVFKWLDDFIEVFKNSKHLYHFLHIPVQSGSDKVLRIMRRGHGVEEYVESVKRIRAEVGNRFTIITDVLIGHPGEEDQDFEYTIEIIKETMPDYINISKFFPRPNTEAKMMKKVPTNIIKARSRRMTELSFKIMKMRNELWRGWMGEVLIDEYGKGGTMVGRNYAFKPIVFNDRLKLGDIIKAKIIDVNPVWLQGKRLS